MLPVQVNYWTLQETIRHNKATEGLSGEQNRIALIQAEAARSQAETAAKRIPIEQMNAETNRMNYGVNLQNAGTNAYNADINRMNAETNARNADINAYNAATNARKVEYDYEIGSLNAATNAYNAETNRKQYNLDALLNPYKIAESSAKATSDIAKASESEAKAEKTRIETKYVPAEKTANIVNTWVDSATSVINTIFPKKKTSTSTSGDAVKTAVEVIGLTGGF